MNRAVFSTLCAALLTGACATTDSCSSLPGNSRYCLVEGPWPEYAAEQISTVTLRNQTLRMITHIESSKSGVRFAGLSLLGQTLFLVSWENSSLRADVPPAVKGQIAPSLFPALLQIATWPAERIREGLSENLELLELPGRRILRSEQSEVLIFSWEGSQLPYQRMRIEVPAMNLIIDNRALEPAN